MLVSFTRKDWLWGLGSFVGILFVFYFVQVLGMQSFKTPFSFILEKWYFLLILAIGFAVQIMLFRNIREKNRLQKSALTASASTSTGSMIACCTHNLALILPFAGLGALGNFLYKYIDYIFIFAIIVMVWSIYTLTKQYRQVHACCVTN